MLRDPWQRLHIKGQPAKRELEDLLAVTGKRLEEVGQPIPRRIHDYMRALQLTRNRAAHHLDATEEDAIESLRHLSEIVQWYFVDFLGHRPGEAASDEVESSSTGSAAPAAAAPAVAPQEKSDSTTDVRAEPQSDGRPETMQPVRPPAIIVSPTPEPAAPAAQITNRPTMPITDRQPLEVITNSIGMRLVLIPPGEFLMGSPDSDPDAFRSEKPQHRVQIMKPFCLGVYAVTQGEYERVMGSNPSWFSAGGGGKNSVAGMDTSRFPVEKVSWEDAVEFCRRLSSRPEEQAAGRAYRLPTEAEWEYACRAGTTTRYCFGDDATELGEYAWFVVNSGNSTHPVGEKRPNAWGLYDMHGNVWEWCHDWYHVDYYVISPSQDPLGPSQASASDRVYRGGSWGCTAACCRSAFRYGDSPSLRGYSLGFRVALVPSGT